MVDVDFPIQGSLKEPLLIMEWIISFLFLELAIVFWLRTRIRKQELKSLQEKAYIWLFFGYSMMWVFIIISDYYINTYILRTLLLNLGFLIQILCAFMFIFIMEKYKIFLRKYLFTKIFLIIIFIYTFLSFFFIEYTARLSTIFWVIFILFFLFYMKEIYMDFYLKRELGHFKFDFLKLIGGVLLVAIGYQLTTRVVVLAIGLSIRIIGDILQIMGLILLFLFFISIPSFSEYDWQEKIKSVLIMYKSGLFIYKRDFQEHIDLIDESLISGTITLLKMMLETFSEREEISIIEKQDNIIIIQPGKYIIGAIICDEKLNSIKILLNKFIERIETIFSHVLAHWDGNLNIFEPIEDISKEIFY